MNMILCLLVCLCFLVGLKCLVVILFRLISVLFMELIDELFY